jgi:phosphoglycolate phosphatase-like HAD superfamily hydrolase
VRIILFDIDGTLLLTGGAGLEALRRVFRGRYEVPEPVSGIDFHGRTDPMILRAIAEKWLGRDLDAREIRQVAGLYVDALEEVLAESPPGFRVLPGAREAVQALHGRSDVALGLATGNFEPSARAKLRHGGLHRYFTFGGYGSDSEDRVELTRMAAERGRAAAGRDAPVLVVGDTVHDVRCAVAIGAECLAVATGNAAPDVLRAAGARWTAESLEDAAAREALGLAGGPD